ncbi:MAG: amino acid ABC transporter substrate-binding protein [Chloroflexi bacterium]|nr:amino acid ABC transporter substrate-binding protein [Chloroflexota bacterium]
MTSVIPTASRRLASSLNNGRQIGQGTAVSSLATTGIRETNASPRAAWAGRPCGCHSMHFTIIIAVEDPNRSINDTMNQVIMLKQTVILFFALFLSSACQANNAAWERIEKAGVLRVGLDPTYPPFEVVDDNGLRGLDVDLAQAIAANLGLEAEFVYFGYDGLYDALATEQVDVLISALVVAPGQTRDFAYSEPYFNAGEILIVPADEMTIEEMGDLDGRTLSVELGALGHVEANAWSRRLPDLAVQPHNSAAEAVTAVAQRQADAALVDAISGRLALIEHPSLERLPQSVTVEPFALVVRVDDEMLLENLNASLQKLQKSGELTRIIAQWFK